MKLLSIAVPCYNSEDYMERCIKTLIKGGDEVEILADSFQKMGVELKEYISDNMESVDDHVCYGLCDINDEFPGCIILYDGIDDLIIVFMSVKNIVGEKELVHYI